MQRQAKHISCPAKKIFLFFAYAIQSRDIGPLLTPKKPRKMFASPKHLNSKQPTYPKTVTFTFGDSVGKYESDFKCDPVGKKNTLTKNLLEQVTFSQFSLLCIYSNYLYHVTSSGRNLYKKNQYNTPNFPIFLYIGCCTSH